MPYKKGKIKTGGRRRNSRNKKSLILATFAQSIVDGGMEKFQEELAKLKGKAYCDIILQMHEWVAPKLQRIEHEHDGLTIINIQPNEISNHLAEMGEDNQQLLCAPDEQP